MLKDLKDLKRQVKLDDVNKMIDRLYSIVYDDGTEIIAKIDSIEDEKGILYFSGQYDFELFRSDRNEKIVSASEIKKIREVRDQYDFSTRKFDKNRWVLVDLSNFHEKDINIDYGDNLMVEMGDTKPINVMISNLNKDNIKIILDDISHLSQEIIDDYVFYKEV